MSYESAMKIAEQRHREHKDLDANTRYELEKAVKVGGSIGRAASNMLRRFDLK